MNGPQYFQIGFNRCGTTSLDAFFRRNGFASVHHDRGRLAIRMDANLRAGRHVLDGCERFEAFFDMSFLRAHIHVEIYKQWRCILEQVPGARFILNVRDVDAWVESRLAMASWYEWRWERPARGFGRPWDVPPKGSLECVPPFRVRYATCHDLPDTARVIAHWRADWDRHVAAVQAGLPPDRLLVFDIERDSPQALCRFAGLDASAARHWKRENPRPGRVARAIARYAPRAVLDGVPDAFRRPARRLFRARDRIGEPFPETSAGVTLRRAPGRSD